jgi:predicted nucleic acid-binding protein
MNGFLLDTNVPSELTRPHPQPGVCHWLDNADDERLYLSVVSLGEILKGITVLPASKRRSGLQQWLDETLRPWFEGRILPVNEPVAERWGSSGRTMQIERQASKSRRWIHRGDRPGARFNHCDSQCSRL